MRMSGVRTTLYLNGYESEVVGRHKSLLTFFAGISQTILDELKTNKLMKKQDKNTPPFALPVGSSRISIQSFIATSFAQTINLHTGGDHHGRGHMGS